MAMMMVYMRGYETTMNFAYWNVDGRFGRISRNIYVQRINVLVHSLLTGVIARLYAGEVVAKTEASAVGREA